MGRILTICAVMMLLASVTSADQKTFTNSGGSVTIGSDLVLASSTLGGPGGTVGFTCPVTSITSVPPPYTAEWSCSGGTFTLQPSDGSMVSGILSGTFALRKGGGDRFHGPSYTYSFTGNFAGTLTSNGQTQAVTGATAQTLATMSVQLGTGTIQNGTTIINPVYTPIYIADTGNNRIVRMDDVTGTNWTTFPPASGSNQFSQPWGISVDGAGKIYVADSGNCRIVRMDNMSGTTWTTLGSCGAGTNQFMNPTGLFVDMAGKIYVADSGNNRIVRIDDMIGTNWTTFGTPGNGMNQFMNPAGIVVDPTGKIYVADTLNSRIIRIDDMIGTSWTAFGTGPQETLLPSGVSFDTSGRIYVADSGNNRIVRIDDMIGTNMTTVGTNGSGNGHLANPGVVFVDRGGTIYVADTSNNRIVRFGDMTGLAWISLGSYGLGVNQFTTPKGVFAVPPATSMPILSLSSASLLFVNQNLGTTSAAQTVTVTNTGSATLSITSVVPSGDFSQTNTCGASIVVGASCTIMITFTPVAGGPRTGALTLIDNAANSPQTVSLSGTGVGGTPAVMLSPASLTFPTQLLNTTSAPQTVTLTNSGNGTLTITSITASGDFQANNCGSSVEAGATCTINVVVTPTAIGTRSGTLTLTDNAVPSPQAVNLTGTGADDFSISGSATSATVNAGQPATYTLSFTGMTGLLNRSVSFTCPDPASTVHCAVSPNPLTLSGTNSATATVTATTMTRAMLLPRTRPPILRPGMGLRVRLLWLLSLAMLVVLLRRQGGLGRRALVGLAGVLLFAAFATGCGGSASAPPAPTGTQAGTYTLVVTATSGTGTGLVIHSAMLTLIVN